MVEGLLGELRDDGMALVVTPDGEQIEVAAEALRLRLDAAFRVIAPVGGWQSGTLVEASSEGLYRVALAGGTEVWTTAEQIVGAHAPADAVEIADGTLAAVLPEADADLAAARWVPGAGPRRACGPANRTGAGTAAGEGGGLRCLCVVIWNSKKTCRWVPRCRCTETG